MAWSFVTFELAVSPDIGAPAETPNPFASSRFDSVQPSFEAPTACARADRTGRLPGDTGQFEGSRSPCSQSATGTKALRTRAEKQMSTRPGVGLEGGQEPGLGLNGRRESRPSAGAGVHAQDPRRKRLQGAKPAQWGSWGDSGADEEPVTPPSARRRQPA